MKVGSQLYLLYPWGKSPWYTLNRRLGGPHSWSGFLGYKKNLLPMPGIKLQFLVCPTRSLVIIPTEISWLLEGGMMVTKQDICLRFHFMPIEL
jgi:hypothetical protein